jgi:hypothetical protein
LPRESRIIRAERSLTAPLISAATCRRPLKVAQEDDLRVEPAQPARNPALDIRDFHLGAAATFPAELLLGRGYREQFSPEQYSIVLVADTTIVIDEAMEEVLGKMLHLAS